MISWLNSAGLSSGRKWPAASPASSSEHWGSATRSCSRSAVSPNLGRPRSAGPEPRCVRSPWSRSPSSGIAQQAEEGAIVAGSISDRDTFPSGAPADAVRIGNPAIQDRAHDEEVPRAASPSRRSPNRSAAYGDEPAEQGAPRHAAALGVVIGIDGDDARGRADCAGRRRSKRSIRRSRRRQASRHVDRAGRESPRPLQ